MRETQIIELYDAVRSALQRLRLRGWRTRGAVLTALRPRCPGARRAGMKNENTMAPFLGPQCKEADGGKSGKAMQGAVPPAGTAIREVAERIEESHGHARGGGLFLDEEQSTCNAKKKNAVIKITAFTKSLISER